MAARARITFVLCVFLSFGTHASAVDVLWTDSTTGQILRGQAGDGPAEVLFNASDYPTSPAVVAPFGIASDDEFVYWSDSLTGEILRGSLDGEGAATLLFDRNDYPGGSIFARPTGLSVDESFIYWADSGTGAILRGPKNGSGAVTSLYTAANYPGVPAGVFPWDLKVSNGQIYWTDAGVSQVLRGATDGSSPVQTLFTTASGRVNLGMAIDGDLIYWGDTDNGEHAGSVQGGSLSGMGLPETLYELADYPSSAASAAPTGIAAQDGQLYWVDSLTKQVLTASSSGSGQISILFDIEDYPGAPDYISPTFLTIVSSGYDADFNDDGIVDGQDFLVWQRGQSPAPLSADDLALWKLQFGSTPQLQSNQSIPEPLTITLALTACLAAIAGGRLRS